MAGILELKRDARANAAALREMCRVMVYRGPDDEGIYIDDAIGLGMRRMRVVYLATGHRPIWNEDVSLWIVFNGKIYNHGELREQLIAHGHLYSTHTDTETMFICSKCWGRLRKQTARHVRVRHLEPEYQDVVHGARPAGIKPLYYKLTPERLLLGSEIKVLLAHGGIRPEFNRAALPEYLAFGYLSGQDTFYSGIQKLLPGHTMTMGLDGKSEIKQYWDLDTSKLHESRDENYSVRTYRELLEGADESHLMSDVPLGMFLSGGLDSSAVAALDSEDPARTDRDFFGRLQRAGLQRGGVTRTVAAHIQSKRRGVIVGEEDFFGALPHLIWH